MLQSRAAVRLYHEYARLMPVIDYHNHLSPQEIAENSRYIDISQVWLSGDHYKWRAMRANGIDEKFITGDAPGREKFSVWAKTMPAILSNPLYAWTHLELARYFGIDNMLLFGGTGNEIYDKCNELLAGEEYLPRKLIERMNVEVLCTTDDPVDSLQFHRQVNAEHGSFRMYPAWRPDMAMRINDPAAFNQWVDSLGRAANAEIGTFGGFIDALGARHDFFHSQGCRISDYGLDIAFGDDFTESEIKDTFATLRSGRPVPPEREARFKSAMLFNLCSMDQRKNWVQQFHIGALRNINTRYFEKLGRDTGFDAIGDAGFADSLAKILDRLDKNGSLAKTVLYTMNPAYNSIVATIAGCFQDSSAPGKMQFGSAWWFLDQKDGIEDQLRTLSSMGVLGRFIGMTTDSRSILSFVRHEYFRRILCNLIGDDMEKGLLPDDFDLAGSMVRDICYNNAKAYFSFK